MSRKLSVWLAVLGVLGLLIAGLSLLPEPGQTTSVSTSTNLNDMRSLMKAEQAAINSFQKKSTVTMPGLALALLCLPTAGVLAIVRRSKRKNDRNTQLPHSST